jgi:phosphatidylglycerophosphate synthase
MSSSAPRFLGLTAAERNARVLRRMPHLADGLTIPPDAIITPDGATLDVSTATARRRAAWRLLRASGKPTDGWLSRHVHRKISRLCSYVLLRLGLTADIATFLTFLVGVAAAWLMAQTTHETMIAGALLFWFASIADGIDGEMARLTLTESAYGEQLDTAVDHATHLLGYAGVMVGWWRQGISPAGWALAIGVALGLPVALLYAMHLVRRAQGLRDQFFVDTKPIELGIRSAARATGAPALRLAGGVFVLFRREAFSLTFFLVSLVTGWRGIYPALLAVGLAVVAATLIAYRNEIESAIRRTRAG